MKIVEMLIVAAAAFLALVSIIEAGPDFEGESILLWNGEDHVRVNAENTGDMHSGQLNIPESLSCSGSTLCGGPLLPNGGPCNDARRIIQRDNRYFTGGDSGSTGVCRNHCGLFVSGNSCDLFGSEMFTAFDQLRAHGCRICGVKTFDDGCKFKMDYVANC